MKIRVSLSALTPIQFRPYVKGWNKSRYYSIFKKFTNDPKAYRIYIPLQHLANVNDLKQPHPINPPPSVTNALRSLGFLVVDYRDGIAMKLDGTDNRIFKIGRILAKMPVEKSLFDNDPRRKQSKTDTNNMVLCISRHPYDIASMSTGRGWTSCMRLSSPEYLKQVASKNPMKSQSEFDDADYDDMDDDNEYTGGQNRSFVMNDVKQGTIIAYLIDKTDTNIKHPKGRVLIKPFVNIDDPDDVLLVREEKVYGEVSANIAKAIMITIDNWLDAVNGPRKTAFYKLAEGLYHDRIPRRVRTYAPEDKAQEDYFKYLKELYDGDTSDIPVEILAYIEQERSKYFLSDSSNASTRCCLLLLRAGYSQNFFKELVTSTDTHIIISGVNILCVMAILDKLAEAHALFSKWSPATLGVAFGELKHVKLKPEYQKRLEEFVEAFGRARLGVGVPMVGSPCKFVAKIGKKIVGDLPNIIIENLNNNVGSNVGGDGEKFTHNELFLLYKSLFIGSYNGVVYLSDEKRFEILKSIKDPQMRVELTISMLDEDVSDASTVISKALGNNTALLDALFKSSIITNLLLTIGGSRALLLKKYMPHIFTKNSELFKHMRHFMQRHGMAYRFSVLMSECTNIYGKDGLSNAVFVEAVAYTVAAALAYDSVKSNKYAITLLNYLNLVPQGIVVSDLDFKQKYPSHDVVRIINTYRASKKNSGVVAQILSLFPDSLKLTDDEWEDEDGEDEWEN